MPDIGNYSVYNDRMRRSMWDKAFFMDKIPGTELLIDFGCADGSLIRFLHGLFPAMRFIGFDADPSMIAAARKQETENAWFFTEKEEVTAQIRRLNTAASATAVNFSSVFHEIFHYGADLNGIRAFLRLVSPQYLVVRDMMYGGNPLAPAPEEAVRIVRSRLPARQIQDFERCHGPVSVRKNLVHLLLKYKYTENWERECAENYFSYTEEDLARVLNPEGTYRRILFFRYILPWIRHDLETGFGIDPGDGFTTHYALILSAARPGLVPLSGSAPAAGPDDSSGCA